MPYRVRVRFRTCASETNNRQTVSLTLPLAQVSSYRDIVRVWVIFIDDTVCIVVQYTVAQQVQLLPQSASGVRCHERRYSQISASTTLRIESQTQLLVYNFDIAIVLRLKYMFDVDFTVVYLAHQFQVFAVVGTDHVRLLRIVEPSLTEFSPQRVQQEFRTGLATRILDHLVTFKRDIQIVYMVLAELGPVSVCFYPWRYTTSFQFVFQKRLKVRLEYFFARLEF